MTPTEFLLARIAEDEEAARAAVVYPEAHERSQRMMKDPTIWNSKTYPHGIIDQARWDAEYPGPSEIPDAKYWADEISNLEGIWEVDLSHEAIVHAQRHGPARVLTECQAKRQIVELHMPQPWAINRNVPRGTPICGTCGDQEWYAVAAPCPTLHALALPYADHPDYRPEWRP